MIEWMGIEKVLRVCETKDVLMLAKYKLAFQSLCSKNETKDETSRLGDFHPLCDMVIDN